MVQIDANFTVVRSIWVLIIFHHASTQYSTELAVLYYLVLFTALTIGPSPLLVVLYYRNHE